MLQHYEDIVRKQLTQSDAPFLGLLGAFFTPEIRQAIEDSISSNPTVLGYLRHLELYPALSSVYLCAHVMDGVGQEGKFELYSHIRRALQLSADLSQAECEQVWRAFRRALLSLGLEPSPQTSGPHYMVNEYLRQAGVPLAFVDDLAERMLSFAGKVGLPDENDPESIASWQQALEARLDAPFSIVARRAVVLDREGYYTRAFQRVYQADGQSAGTLSALEKAIARAFQSAQAPRSFKRASLPYLTLFDGTLGIFFPAGDDREFSVLMDGTSYTQKTGVEDRFIPLPNQSVAEVVVKDASGQQSSHYRLWADNKANQLLLFSDTGRFKGHGRLNQSSPLVVPPGTYSVLSRFAPTDMDPEAIAGEPVFYAFEVMLHPGARLILRNGPASLALEGESQPLLLWSGDSHTTKEGIEFLHGSLSFTVEIPTEWVAVTGRDYTFRLMGEGLGKDLTLPIRVADSGSIRLVLAENEQVASWRPVFTRLVAELHRPGEARALLRKAAFYWHDLRTIDPGLRFKCERLPENLEPELSENVQQTDTTLSPQDDNVRTFRLVFKVRDKHQSLTWNAPGVFLEIETPTDGGGTVRRSRTLGNTEVVSYTSLKQVLVSASEPGYLWLGDWRQYVDFSRRPQKVLLGSFLAGKVTAQSNTLAYINERTGAEHELLNLALPHHVQALSAEVKNEQLVVHLKTPKELEALTACGKNVLTGKSFDIQLAANEAGWTQHELCRARMMSLKHENEGFKSFVYFDLSALPPGGWVIRFDGCVDGIWGHLENERQDFYGAGLLWAAPGHTVNPAEFIGDLTRLGDAAALAVLRRINEALLCCFALDAWETLKWLDGCWTTLIARWESREAEAVVELIDIAAARPPEDASPSWTLQRAVGARLPKIFGLQAQSYRQLPEKRHPLSRALRAMSEVSISYPAIFPHLIHMAAAAGFSNLHAVVGGERPRGFDLERYATALREMDTYQDAFRLQGDDLMPGPTDYLGPLHFKYAWHALEAAYDRTLTGNEFVRGHAISLAHTVALRLPTLSVYAPPRLIGWVPDVCPWPHAQDDIVAGEALQRRQNLSDISHFLSLLAFICRADARQSGPLTELMEAMSTRDAPAEKSLAYLIQLGEALFAYYLLLWELVLVAEH